MKLGIIIICYNNENDIDISQTAGYFNRLKNVEICLVNNHSSDNTYDVLKELKEHSSNVSVVNIKKHKTEVLAIRAGARFLFNEFNLKTLGYVINDKNIGFNCLAKTISVNKEALLNHTIVKKDTKVVRQTIFQKVFSITDLLFPQETKNRLLHQAATMQKSVG